MMQNQGREKSGKVGGAGRKKFLIHLFEKKLFKNVEKTIFRQEYEEFYTKPKIFFEFQIEQDGIFKPI